MRWQSKQSVKVVRVLGEKWKNQMGVKTGGKMQALGAGTCVRCFNFIALHFTPFHRRQQKLEINPHKQCCS